MSPTGQVCVFLKIWLKQTTPLPPPPQAQQTRLEATEADFEKVRKIVEETWYREFDCETLTQAEAIDDIITNIIGPFGYLQYFDESSLERNYCDSLNDTNYKWDPLKKFQYGNFKLNANNVKWLCENIYHIEFSENYSSEWSYYYEGFIYRHTGQAGDFNPPSKIINHTKLDDGRYEVLIKQEPDNEYNETFKAIVDLQMIDGKKVWTFYSVKKV